MAVADADDRPETRKARPEGECIVVELKIFLSDRKVLALFSPIPFWHLQIGYSNHNYFYHVC